MNLSTAKNLIEDILKSIINPDGSAATEKFSSLRDVDAKVREVKMILKDLPGDKNSIFNEFEQDVDFSANSRRVRLEALAHYCNTALRFLDTGVIHEKKLLVSAPDLSKLTSFLPDLDVIIQDRWLEAQKCQYAKAYLSSVIMMGSILEALLLSRSLMSQPEAFRSKSAPRKKDGSNIPINAWNLNTLLDVAVELGWIKTDRGKFGHALRESRNVVHPWAHVTTKADYDEATCKTCWHVLKASVDDLLNSIA
ncbi:hypothetical protein GCM10008018_36670 [Paenibacillus marchantiophytorum]|uniref:DUF4145 domain-containing protein n=1 Tax=Paenibacillus marchantiophytorum TaxID=1619310 RepID=A0ABQ1EVD5_9BACL|nr:hypothetical protein [Paenibacillus marchantiophytorum]GFZ87166.1 hypothetical protein GCM10008018_36670 [Paenibacillus marchantiophytorum]